MNTTTKGNSMFGEINRILDAIAEAQTKIDALDPITRAKIDGTATLDFDEWFTMGTWGARASQAGIITLDEAMTLHMIHGELPGTFEAASIAERFTFMRFMEEIGPHILAGRM